MATAKTEDLFGKIASVQDTFSSNGFRLRKPSSRGASLVVRGEDVFIDIAGTVSAAAASYRDAHDGDKACSAVLVSARFSFTPQNSAGIRMYAFTVRALGRPDLVARAPDLSDPAAWLGEDDVEKFDYLKARRSIEGGEFPGASWTATSPETISYTSSYTVSVSQRLGMNVNFVGKEETGYLDTSYALSRSDTVNVTPTSIVNRSRNNALQISLIPRSDRSSRFEPTIAGVLRIPEDGEAKSEGRSARELTLEVGIWMVPEGQRATTQNAFRTPRGVVFGEDTYERGYHVCFRYLTLEMPPAVVIRAS